MEFSGNVDNGYRIRMVRFWIIYYRRKPQYVGI